MRLTKDDLQQIIQEELESVLSEKWSDKYKRSIDCDSPKGFSQKAHCNGRKKNEEKNPRIPRKKGQPAKSKKHSDLYTDEDPKGTIHGLKFATEADAKKSVAKIKKSGRSHAHKIQAAVAMEQRAKAAGKKSAAAVYRKYIDSAKKDEELNERCQKGYKTHPTRKTKEMFGRTYRNCVKAEEGLETDISEFKEKELTDPCEMAKDPTRRPIRMSKRKAQELCKDSKKNEDYILSEDKEIINKINEFLNSGELNQVIYGINFAGTMGYPIESIDIHGLIKNIPNWGDDMMGAAIEISDAMLENYEEYYSQFVDDAMRSQRAFRKDPNEITENDKINLFMKFYVHLNDEAQVYPNVKKEAKAYHWDESDWHYDGGYGDPEGPDSKWYMTEAELEEKKKKRKKAGTESSKESSLRDWFGRKGAKGKKKGWVDCNAPDGKGGYKSCGRSDGEKRKKYPACRPTPGACKERGKGKSWGKKAKKRGKRK